LVGLSTYLVVLTPRRYRVNALFLIALLMCISSFVFQQAEDLLLDVLGKDPDLTGRTEYWNYILSSMADYWVIGHGYFAGFLRIAGDIEDIMGANFGSTHNGYLDIFVSFGLLGLFVAIGYLTWLLLGCIRLILVATPEFGRLATFPICAFTFVVQHSLVESGILAGNSIFPLLLALASGMIVRANTLIQTRDKNNYFGYPIQSAKVTAHYAATQHESGRKAEISRLPLHLN